MIDYGQGGVAGGYGGNDFSAQPRLVNGIKFKDPYGRNVEYVHQLISTQLLCQAVLNQIY